MQDYPYTIAFFENRLKKAKEKLQHSQVCHRDEEAIRIISKIIHYQRALEALSAPETMRKQSALERQEISRIRQNAYGLRVAAGEDANVKAIMRDLLVLANEMEVERKMIQRSFSND